MSKVTVDFPYGWPEPINVQLRSDPTSDPPLDVSDMTEAQLTVDLVKLPGVTLQGVASTDPVNSFDFDVSSLPVGVWECRFSAAILTTRYPMGSFYLNIYAEECDCNGGC